MKAKVKKFGDRGAHILVPNSWRDCDVEVTLISKPKGFGKMLYSKEDSMLYDKKEPIPLRPTPTHALSGVSEGEARFLDMMRYNPNPVVRRRAVKEFGEERVKELLNEKQN